jgi:hypothetical protein
MRTTRRRARKIDPLATSAGVRAVCERLRVHCPALIPKTDQQLISLLNAVRHFERQPVAAHGSGRSGQWKREDLQEVARHLRALLKRETKGRVSLSSFIGLYLRILDFPADVNVALDQGEINLQEATLLARLTADRLEISPAKASTLRREVLNAHLKSQGSQNSLRARVKELLGETNFVSAATMTNTVRQVDELLAVDPQDKRHLFYEEIRNLFYALREIRPEDLDDQALETFSEAADRLSAVLFSILQKRRHKERLNSKLLF